MKILDKNRKGMIYFYKRSLYRRSIKIVFNKKGKMSYKVIYRQHPVPPPPRSLIYYIILKPNYLPHAIACKPIKTSVDCGSVEGGNQSRILVEIHTVQMKDSHGEDLLPQRPI
jgi:hypothetical protein